MTRIPTNGFITNPAIGAGESLYLYYLIAPATTANNVVVSISGGNQAIRGVSTSYTDAKQSAQPDASANNVADVANTITTSVTTVADNCWTVSVSTNDSDFPAASTGLTERTQSSILGIGDSNAAITPAGAYSMTWDTEGAGNVSWCMIAASFSPVPPAVTTKTLAALGVG